LFEQSEFEIDGAVLDIWPGTLQQEAHRGNTVLRRHLPQLATSMIMQQFGWDVAWAVLCRHTLDLEQLILEVLEPPLCPIEYSFGLL
jgi:hypothetical protein